MINKSGSIALVTVLAIVGILMIAVYGNYKTSRQHRQILRKNALGLQAYYMAAAALQHAELKVRYFPTELYDASEYSLGKNPYFDFAEITVNEYNNLAPLRKAEYKPTPGGNGYYMHMAGQFNPGPRFISHGTLQTNTTEKWFRLAELDPEDTLPANFLSKANKWFPNGWPKIDGKEVPNSDLYLWKFFNDITSDGSRQPALQCVRDPNFNIGTQNSLPFSGGYEVKNMQVIAMKEHKRLNQEAVKIVVSGWIIDPITNETITMNIEKTIKVSRK